MLSCIGKKVISLITVGAIFIGLLPAFTYAASPIIEPVPIANPGFEDVQGSKPTGWSYWKSGHAVGMSVSESVYNEGSKSLKLDIGVDQVVGVESTKFPLVAGDNYTVTTSVYVEKIDASVSNAYVSIWVKYYDDNNVAVTPDKSVNLSSSEYTIGEWFDLPIKMMPPAGATQGQIFIYVNRATISTTYYDNIRIEHEKPIISDVDEGPPKNGNFEASLGADLSIPGWTSSPAVAPEGNSVSISDEYAVSGTQSLKIVDASSTASIGALSDPIPVAPGNQYSVSLYARVLSSGNGNPFIYFNFYDASNKNLTSPALQNLDVAKEPGVWHKRTPYVNVVAPEGAAYARILFNLGVATLHTVYIDDVVVTEKRVLQNGSFEASVVDNKIPGWELYPDPMPSDRIVSVTNEQASAGEYSVKLEDNSTGSMGIISDPIDIEGGKTYGVSLKTYIESGSSRVYIEYLDDGGKQLEFKSAGISTPLGRWTDLYYELTAPKNATNAKIWLYSGGAAMGTTYYDDVVFQEVSVLALPYEFGESVSLGDATLVSKTQGGTVGNGEIYFGTNGSPSVFYAVDAFTGEVNFKQSLPGEDVVWALAIGSDNNVYVAGTQTGFLYRYKPETKELENLGVNPSNKWIWDLDASSDGKIYGSTYASQNGKTFVYDITTGKFTDIGVAKPGQDYVRGSGVSGDYFYAGTGTTAYLFRYNRATLEKTEISLPITGMSTSISNVYAYGGKLFVVYGTSLIIMDEKTEKVLHQIDWQSPYAFDGLLSSPSPYDENLIYFRNKTTSKLWTYNLSTDEFVIAEEDLTLPNLSSKIMDWVEIKEGPKAGRKVLLIMTNEINVTLYDPIDHTFTTYNPKVSTVGIDVQSLETGPDGNLYMGGYQGAMSVYDTQLGQFTVQEKEPHQIEGIGFLNGKVYYGIYGGAVIYEYDPAQPFEMGKNPYVIHDIQSGQSRPFTFTSGEDKLFVGTVADYGQLGGALTVYDSVANTWIEHRNIVQNQSVIGLAYLNGKVYGGTSIWGGLGIEPSESEARLFEWDVAAEKAVYIGKPNIPDFSPQMIGELSIGPDGNVWGIMWGSTPTSDSAFALFVMEPDTKAIVKSRIMNTGARASTWRPFFMRWGEDGLLYTTIGRELYAFDPDTLANNKLVNDYVHMMTLGPDGSIYYASGSKLMKMPVRMREARLIAPARTMKAGETLDLNIELLLVNGQAGNSDGTTIQYSVSDPTIAEVRNGKLIGLRSGIVSLSATVKQDSIQVETNTIEIEVAVDEVPGFEFSILDMTFTDWSNNPVTHLQPNTMIRGQVKVKNDTNVAREAILIVALYNNEGEMVNVSLLSREFGPKTEDIIQAGFRLQDEVDGYTIRAMVWDNLDDMKPLAPVLSLSSK